MTNIRVRLIWNSFACKWDLALFLRVRTYTLLDTLSRRDFTDVTKISRDFKDVTKISRRDITSLSNDRGLTVKRKKIETGKLSTWIGSRSEIGGENSRGKDILNIGSGVSHRQTYDKILNGTFARSTIKIVKIFSVRRWTLFSVLFWRRHDDPISTADRRKSERRRSCRPKLT